MIPTTGNPDKTVCTLFINNGHRYLAWGVGLFYVPIPNEDYFNAVKAVLQQHDIPTQETAEQDPRIYGIELVGQQAVAQLQQNDANIGTALTALQQNGANIGARILAKLVQSKDDPTGAVYVVTQNSFNHITGAALEAGAALGLWGGFPDVVTLTPEQVAALAEHLGGKLYVAPAAG